MALAELPRHDIAPMLLNDLSLRFYAWAQAGQLELHQRLCLEPVREFQSAQAQHSPQLFGGVAVDAQPAELLLGEVEFYLLQQLQVGGVEYLRLLSGKFLGTVLHLPYGALQYVKDSPE